MSNEEKEILVKALEVLEQDGWCQRTSHNVLGQRCSLGAIERGARSLGIKEYVRIRRAADRLYRAIGENRGGVASWNDKEGRTYEDVVLAFKKAIHDE